MCRPIPKIVTVEVDREGEDPVSPVLRRAPARIVGRARRKTALAPPAVRAPVFPHALPVTEGLKPAILVGGTQAIPFIKDLIRNCLTSPRVLSLKCL